jgi:hypothetical protein
MTKTNDDDRTADLAVSCTPRPPSPSLMIKAISVTPAIAPVVRIRRPPEISRGEPALASAPHTRPTSQPVRSHRGARCRSTRSRPPSRRSGGTRRVRGGAGRGAAAPLYGLIDPNEQQKQYEELADAVGDLAEAARNADRAADAARTARAVKRSPQPPAVKPSVTDPNLQNIMNDLYKGTTNPNRVGSCTTADAICNELRTGQPTGSCWMT